MFHGKFVVMARIVPSHLITSISGKLCKQDTTYIGVNKHTGKMYSAGYHGCSQPNSDEQQAVKASFKKKSQFASAWWKQNRPSDKSAKGTDAYLAVMKAYKVQHKIGNPYSFMRSLVTDDLKVMLAGNDITGGVTAGGAAAGGGSTTGGGGTVTEGGGTEGNGKLEA